MSSSKKPRSFDLRHLPRPWAISALLALALSVLLGQQAFAHVQQGNDMAAIEHVVVKAAGVSLQAVVMPNTLADYTAAFKSAKASKGTAAAKPLAASPAELGVAQSRAHALFDSVYSTACAPCQIESSKAIQTLQAEGQGTFRALASQVRDVVFQQVLLNGDTASVVMSYTLWSKVQYVNEYGQLNTVTPTGGDVMIYTLAKVNGNWLITNQVPDDVAASSLPINQQKPNAVPAGGPPADQPPPVKIDPTGAPTK